MTLPIVGGLLVGFSVGAVAGWVARSAAQNTSTTAPQGDSPESGAVERARAELERAETRAREAEQALHARAEAQIDVDAHANLQLKHDVLAQRVREAEAALEVCHDRCNKLREAAGVTAALQRQLKSANAEIEALKASLEALQAREEQAPPPTAKPEQDAMPSAPSVPSAQPDDLRTIPGVGPKIERLLRANGVESFAQLAACSPEQVRSYLVQGGAHMAKYDPVPWIAAAADRVGD